MVCCCTAQSPYENAQPNCRRHPRPRSPYFRDCVSEVGGSNRRRLRRNEASLPTPISRDVIAHSTGGVNRPGRLLRKPTWKSTTDLTLMITDPRPGATSCCSGSGCARRFVGAAFAAAGFVDVIDPRQGLPFLTALTWIAAGSTFAWLARQRTAALLERVDADESTQADRDDASPIRQVVRAPVSSGRTSPPNRCQPEVS